MTKPISKKLKLKWAINRIKCERFFEKHKAHLYTVYGNTGNNDINMFILAKNRKEMKEIAKRELRQPNINYRYESGDLLVDLTDSSEILVQSGMGSEDLKELETNLYYVYDEGT